ncbi:unnamed protein product [Fraxinus pennsylvanica]|uniref:Clp1 C-terminal domain-containing protein n=1 Tax=Fraxinus pennsylvanica TaxID=56036 RepID=A0AAD1ZNK9_9LAMI|nr:unnamed protein product [Fraxinus pennsylvanica]
MLHLLAVFICTNCAGKLCSMLKHVLKNKSNVDVAKLQKSGDVVSRNAKFRQKRTHRIWAADHRPHVQLCQLSLAVSAKEPDEIISSNVTGFIWIIDFESKKIAYLAPATGSLPGQYLIQGSLIGASVPRLDLGPAFEQKNDIAKAVDEELEKVTCPLDKNKILSNLATPANTLQCA